MPVNLSASNLLDVTLAERVAELLLRHDVPASALVLEVTETVLLSDAETGTAVLPAGELELDRSFTVDLLADARAAEIVGSTIELAHRLGLRVVAECDESQGYLHARPLPPSELTAWLGGQLPAPQLTAAGR